MLTMHCYFYRQGKLTRHVRRVRFLQPLLPSRTGMSCALSSDCSSSNVTAAYFLDGLSQLRVLRVRLSGGSLSGLCLSDFCLLGDRFKELLRLFRSFFW